MVQVSESKGEWEDTACNRKYYSSIKSCVMLNSVKSDRFISNIGVRQGENLSSLLFGFNINDIENKLLEYNNYFLHFGHDLINLHLKLLVLLYADETVILYYSEEEMKQALEALYTHCYEWKSKLKCNKTKIVVF